MSYELGRGAKVNGKSLEALFARVEELESREAAEAAPGPSADLKSLERRYEVLQGQVAELAGVVAALRAELARRPPEPLKRPVGRPPGAAKTEERRL